MGRSVIVISSVNLDTTLRVPYFPKPGESLQSEKTTTSLGGKGANVAIAAAHGTESVYLAGAIGPDGGDAEKTLQAHGVDTRYLKRTDTETGRAVILVNGSGENCIIVSKGANARVTRDIISEMGQVMCEEGVVVLQLEIEHGVTQELGVLAKGMGNMVVFNPSPTPTRGSEVFDEKARIWKVVDVVVLNKVEIEEISGVGQKQDGIDVMEGWGQSILEVRKRCREDVTVVLTLGKDGVVYYREGLMKHVAAVEVDDADVVDTTAAGDTFTGFLVAGLADGMQFEQCIRVAVAAAAVCVTRAGAVNSIPTMEEVEQCM